MNQFENFGAASVRITLMWYSRFLSFRSSFASNHQINCVTNHIRTLMGPKKKQQTPPKAKEESDDTHETFSPVLRPRDSPGLQKGNLTGTVRKLKDSAADLYNLMHKWRVLNVDGSNIISQIANIKLEQIENTQSDALPESLLPLCDQMAELLDKMEKVAFRLSGMTETIKGVVQLERYNQCNSTEIVLFQTWNVSKFEDIFIEICEMVHKELTLKKCISRNICHGQTRDVIMFYSAAWLHQPYIDSNCDMLIESMLLETKHKT